MSDYAGSVQASTPAQSGLDILTIPGPGGGPVIEVSGFPATPSLPVTQPASASSSADHTTLYVALGVGAVVIVIGGVVWAATRRKSNPRRRKRPSEAKAA